jgi:photosystem II stability/assembly factor-like uncharacterized protein
LLCLLLALAVLPTALLAQLPNGTPDYKLRPALTGVGRRFLVGLKNGGIQFYRNSAGVAQLDSTAQPGGTIPADVDGIWALAMPNREANPTVVVALVSYTTDAGRRYGFMRSTDFGDSWELNKDQALADTRFVVASSYWEPNRLSSMSWLPDGQNGWIYGNGGIFRTTNGGQTWQFVYKGGGANASDQVVSLAFADPMNGAASLGWLGDRTAWASTTDGGETWTEVEGGAKRRLQVNWVATTWQYRGLVIDRFTSNTNTSMHYSNDFGEKWKETQIPYTKPQTFMAQFVWANAKEGFLVHPQAETYKTADSGRTWQAVHPADASIAATIGSAFGSNAVLLDQNAIAYVVTRTDDGAVYRAMIIAVAVDGSAGVPSETVGEAFSASVFPNPATSELRVGFELPHSAAVTLRLVDLLGREVGAQNLGMMESGVRSVRFDLAGIPAGSYRCIVDAGDMRVARPVVVMH